MKGKWQWLLVVLGGWWWMGAGQVIAEVKPRLILEGYERGGRVEVRVAVDGGRYPISGVETEIDYDEDELELISHRVGKSFEVVLREPEDEGGKIGLSVGVAPGDGGVKGEREVVRLSFRKTGEKERLRFASRNTIITSLAAEGNLAQGETEIELVGGTMEYEEPVEQEGYAYGEEEDEEWSVEVERDGGVENWWRKLLKWFKSLFS